MELKWAVGSFKVDIYCGMEVLIESVATAMSNHSILVLKLTSIVFQFGGSHEGMEGAGIKLLGISYAKIKMME